jgi:hypothetical protein
MADRIGVWVDHRRAVVVMLGSADPEIKHVTSNVEKHGERGGDSPLKGPYEANQVPADDRRQGALTRELNVYYDAVIAALGDFKTVLLFGPGEAKGELRKRLTHANLGERIAAVEPSDKMTDQQIVAKVRAFFKVALPRA